MRYRIASRKAVPFGRSVMAAHKNAVAGTPPVGGGAWMPIAAVLFVPAVLLDAGSMGIWLDRQIGLLRARHAVLLEQRSRDLEAAIQAQSRFVADFSDEIMRPTNAVLGFADLVMRGDAPRLGQLLVNLVRNGLKFTSRGSVGLRVRTVEGDAARLHF